MAAQIDYQVVVGRLRPHSEYQWTGNGLGTYADIGEWRDPSTTKPTLQEIQAEWEVYLIEQQAELAIRAKLAQARQDYGATALDLTAYSGQQALIQKLAQKIAWLEQEIVDLRKGG